MPLFTACVGSTNLSVWRGFAFPWHRMAARCRVSDDSVFILTERIDHDIQYRRKVIMVYRPFNQVPPEILSHILSLAWLSDTREDSLARFQFPSIPAQVDRYFNRTTLCTNILWSYLRVTKETNLGHVQDRIKRSGAVPLDLYLVFSETQSPDALRMVERTMVHNRPRFRKIAIQYQDPSIIDIDITSTEEFWEHLTPLSNLSPPLDVACFSIADEGNHVPDLNLLPMLSSSLHTLNISNCNFSWSPPPLQETIEVLSIDEVRRTENNTLTTQITQYLSGSLSRSLRFLTLTGMFIAYNNIVEESCVLSSLEGLKLDNLLCDEAAILLYIISTPKLLHLSLKGIYDYFSDNLSLMWKGLRFPTLRKLTLQDAFQKDTPHLLEFVMNLPDSTNHLELIQDETEVVDYGINSLLRPSASTFFHRLHHIVADGVPLPTLANLVGGRCGLLKTLEARFKNVVQARGSLSNNQLAFWFAILSSSANEFKILKVGEDPYNKEPALLSFAQLDASPLHL